MGFGTDQGKTGNINGMGIVAQVLGKTIPQVGTTTFRPNYTPVTFGALSGIELGDAFDPIRTTAMHEWHVRHAALFEDVGQWKRPWYYPKPGEDLHAAVHRETLAVRNGVGTLDPGQDRHPGARCERAAELGVQQRLVQAGNWQVPLRPDAG
jgi:sarcosine oxidase subunit alpha